MFYYLMFFINKKTIPKIKIKGIRFKETDKSKIDWQQLLKDFNFDDSVKIFKAYNSNMSTEDAVAAVYKYKQVLV